jgi:hypothetical protein
LVQSGRRRHRGDVDEVDVLDEVCASSSIQPLTASRRSTVRTDWLSRAIGLDTPPTATFWMCGVLLPRMETILLALRWTSSACR